MRQSCLQVPVTFIYGEHDWMNPAAGVEVAEILDKVRERKVGGQPEMQVLPPATSHET